MLITGLLPLLSRYSLGFDLVAGADNVVTLTVIPRKAEGDGKALDSIEVRPIAITAPAAEIDAELARGTQGALGQIFTARKELGDQLAEQRAATEAARTAKTKPPGRPGPAAKPVEPAAPPPPAEPAGPASLW